MKTLTIIVQDNQVYIDGIPRAVDCSKLTFYALQWDAMASAGHIEYAPARCPTCNCINKKPNEPVNDVTPYQAYIAAWATAPNPGEPNNAS
jgi:hypothetical protein